MLSQVPAVWALNSLGMAKASVLDVQAFLSRLPNSVGMHFRGSLENVGETFCYKMYLIYFIVDLIS